MKRNYRFLLLSLRNTTKLFTAFYCKDTVRGVLGMPLQVFLFNGMSAQDKR